MPPPDRGARSPRPCRRWRFRFSRIVSSSDSLGMGARRRWGEGGRGEGGRRGGGGVWGGGGGWGGGKRGGRAAHPGVMSPPRTHGDGRKPLSGGPSPAAWR